MTDHNHRLDNVRQLHPSPPDGSDGSAPAPADNQLVETVAGHLIRLRDLGRDIEARATVSVIPDPTLILAGQRVEAIAERLFVEIFTERPPQ